MSNFRYYVVRSGNPHYNGQTILYDETVTECGWFMRLIARFYLHVSSTFTSRKPRQP